jgi:hypothetical protein
MSDEEFKDKDRFFHSKKSEPWLQRFIGRYILISRASALNLDGVGDDALETHPDKDLAESCRVSMMKLQMIREALRNGEELPGFLQLTTAQREFAASEAGRRTMRRFLEVNGASIDSLDFVAIELVTDQYTETLRSFIERVTYLETSLCASFPDVASQN